MKLTLVTLLLITLGTFQAEAYQKGMALGLFHKEPNFDYSRDLREIRALGVDSVSLIVSWFQTDITANEIFSRSEQKPEGSTFPDRQLRRVIRQARELGLNVFLFPTLRIDKRGPKEWRGVLKPKDKAAWLQSYRRFILHYATLAAEEKVSLFSVGSELCSMEKEQEYWTNLIAEIRKTFHGKLIYSANWDHYEPVGFWSALDYLGLTGYYELSQTKNPTLPQLVERWKEIQKPLETWQKKHGRKIIFTEIGYPSLDGTNIYPWDYTRQEPVDSDEQALCYEAFFQAWYNHPTLEGVYFWNWFGSGGRTDGSYTPRDKPAEAVLRKWYGSSLPTLLGSLR
ncbi:MAG: hypothetical protein Q7S98_03390 [Deltaproteobacteria bacterium]|nr:hypothetical protein [Deltaproteobacteria bacterium]